MFLELLRFNTASKTPSCILDKESLFTFLESHTASHDVPVQVITVAGSSPQNRFLLYHYFFNQEGGGDDEELLWSDYTALISEDFVGLCIWWKLITFPNQQSAIILDFSIPQNSTYCKNLCISQVFAGICSISSKVILTVSSELVEGDLRLLESFTDFEDGNQINLDFKILVQGWHNPGTFQYGIDGGAKYIDDMLDINPGMSHGKMKCRKALRKRFPNLQCWLLPHCVIKHDGNFTSGKFVELIANIFACNINPTGKSTYWFLNHEITVCTFLKLVEDFCAQKFICVETPKFWGLMNSFRESQLLSLIRKFIMVKYCQLLSAAKIEEVIPLVETIKTELLEKVSYASQEETMRTNFYTEICLEIDHMAEAKIQSAENTSVAMATNQRDEEVMTTVLASHPIKGSSNPSASISDIKDETVNGKDSVSTVPPHPPPPPPPLAPLPPLPPPPPTLSDATTGPPPPDNNRNNLLKQIKVGVKLRKVDKGLEPPPKTDDIQAAMTNSDAFQNQLVAALEARNARIAMSDSEEEDNNWD